MSFRSKCDVMVTTIVLRNIVESISILSVIMFITGTRFAWSSRTSTCQETERKTREDTVEGIRREGQRTPGSQRHWGYS